VRVARVLRLAPRAQAALIALSGGVLLGLSLLRLVPPWAAVAGSVLLALPMVARLSLVLGLGEAGRGLLVSRIVPGSPVEGYPVPVRLVLESRSPLVWLLVDVVDSPPGDVPLLSSPRFRGVLLPGGEVRGQYYVAPRLGYRRMGPVTLRVYDLLGLYEAVVEVEPEGDALVYALPSRQLASRELRLLELEDPYTVPRARLIRREGTEIYTIREFQEGDEPRLIDWKATARRGKLYVKELRRETYVPVLFVVAASPRSLEGPVFKTAFERLLRSIAALAEDIISRDGTVGLLVAHTPPLAEPPLKAGEGLSRIYRLLGMAPLPAREPQGVVRLVTDYLRRHSPGRTTIVVATDRQSLRAVWREMGVLAERKYRIYYLVADESGTRLASHEAAPSLAREGGASG